MIEFREARPQDDAQLTQLVGSPMPGNLSLAFCREPSYLESCVSCGPIRRVLTAVEGETVVALCSFFLREYQWAGQARQVWTLSDFRAVPEQAGRSITGRGWTAIRSLLDGRPAMISVLRDNQRALKLFSKPRPGWPRLAPIGDLCTNITPLWKWPRVSHPHSVRVLDQAEVADFVNGSKEALSPLVDPNDFGTVLPPAQRFWGVFGNDGRLVGCAGLSESGNFRQVKIHSYAGFYGKLHLIGRYLGLPMLPEPGSKVRLSTACLLHCPQPGPFRALFDRLKAEAQAVGSKFLVWCRGGDDPTWPWDRLRFRYHSRLYQLLWEGDQPLPQLSSPLGYEVAWL